MCSPLLFLIVQDFLECTVLIVPAYPKWAIPDDQVSSRIVLSGDGLAGLLSAEACIHLCRTRCVRSGQLAKLCASHAGYMVSLSQQEHHRVTPQYTGETLAENIREEGSNFRRYVT
jgi:hypothetical protein